MQEAPRYRQTFARLLGLKSLTDAIGVRFEHAGAAAIPLPHPSGASGWLNDRANHARLARAIDLIHERLRALQ